MRGRPPRRARDGGAVLVLVLVFALLLTSSVATFLRRATVDATIARNQDAAARAGALARGGIRLAEALVLEDRLREAEAEIRVETRFDLWARVPAEIPAGDDAVLRLRIEDAGARLNLNALFSLEGPRDEATELLLTELFDKLILETPGDPGQRNYDPGELARNLIDWVDPDTVRMRGGYEDDGYQSQDPPYRAANRPLLSVDELRLVEGFDGDLVEALRPYVTVFPYAGGDGVNPNTAPSWVLALLYHGIAGEFRLAQSDAVGDLLDVREGGGVLCPNEWNQPWCTDIYQVLDDTIFPEPTIASDVFLVTAEAEVEGIRRTIEAVLDRSTPADPQLLSWRVR